MFYLHLGQIKTDSKFISRKSETGEINQIKMRNVAFTTYISTLIAKGCINLTTATRISHKKRYYLQNEKQIWHGEFQSLGKIPANVRIRMEDRARLGIQLLEIFYKLLIYGFPIKTHWHICGLCMHQTCHFLTVTPQNVTHPRNKSTIGPYRNVHSQATIDHHAIHNSRRICNQIATFLEKKQAY